MQRITEKQVDDLLGQTNYICYMGGVGSDSTKQTIVGVRDEFFLIGANEAIPEELNKRMEEEAREFMESYTFM